MPRYADDEKWEIPAKFRASTDLTDEAAHALLLSNDAEQKKLSERINSPFLNVTPLETQRNKAFITIENLLRVEQFQKLAPDQIEQLAEAYATVGRYDLAAETTKINRKPYKAIWKAVFLDDGVWCEHGPRHQYVKAYIFSIRDSKEVSLLACNICGHLNVADKPAHLIQRHQSQDSHQGKTVGMSMSQIIAYHQKSVQKG